MKTFFDITIETPQEKLATSLQSTKFRLLSKNELYGCYTAKDFIKFRGYEIQVILKLQHRKVMYGTIKLCKQRRIYRLCGYQYIVYIRDECNLLHPIGVPEMHMHVDMVDNYENFIYVKISDWEA